MTAKQNKFLKTLALFLPGIFAVGSNIGTGSVTTMSKAGADFGMQLLWTILLSCCATYFMICIYGKFALVTGQTALQAFRKHIHPAMGIFFIVALTAAVSGSMVGVMGIVADVCYVWSMKAVEGGIHPIFFAAFFIFLVDFVLWRGKTQFFQRALAVTVSIMGISFLINVFLVPPPMGEVINGLIPNLPKEAVDRGGPFMVIAGMVGTTVFSGMFIIRTTLVKEAGWTMEHFKHQRNDAAVSATLMFLISTAIMAAAAGALYANDIKLDKVSQMLGLLEPLAGKMGAAIFAFGIISAGVGCSVPNILMLPWLICDYNNAPRDMTLTKYRIMIVLFSLQGLVVPIVGGKPILVMVVSQALSSVLLPMTTLCILYLTNRKDLMKEHVNKIGANIILVCILILALFNAFTGLKGVIALIKNPPAVHAPATPGK
ncbi:MAG: Nramp family divalent metal transporter [Pontiellaceae bacterium]|nr:Nramp family divalent metal transporter [Pontiellaceae bacterium]